MFSIILSAILAFGMGSLETYFDLIEVRMGMNEFFLFLIDVIVAFLAFWLTKLFLFYKSHSEKKTA
ncbi:hypothetical protein [Peribacillus kribbensis]|uniref:hypothetical protein n=1 Tax=Peribacillus kribbensis TaxID=356658 RepID=UPI0004141ECA|nr:hypothetical protein [Peribacillus kribbensis]